MSSTKAILSILSHKSGNNSHSPKQISNIYSLNKMKFVVNCAFSAVLSTLMASSSLAFSNSRGPKALGTYSPSTISPLYMGDEPDDYDDFFADYDPSQYDSYDNFSDDGSVSYGGGGGGGGYGSGRGRGRGRGGGGGGRSWDYTRDTSRDSSNVDVAAVEGLIQERSQAKRNRDYETADAIRDQLMNDFHVGIDDREKTWRTGVSRSGSGRGNFGNRGRNRGSPHRGGGGRRPRQDFGPNGHDYSLTADSGPNASGMSDQEINQMISERLMAKLSRDFGTADAIQVDLVARGVFVHDGIKEYRTDGVAYGDFSERRGNPRGNPGPTRGSRNDAVAYRKSSYSGDAEGIEDEMIDKLVAERLNCKMMRDFEKADAIREGLRSKYNVLIDDRLKMWSVGGDFGEEHNARRELSHQFATRGYIKSKSSLSISEEDEAYIQEQLDERAAAKRDRDFRTADDIRENLLQQFDVSVNDKMKLWSVGGAFEEAGGKTRAARGVYTRRGGGNLSEDAVAEIQDLLMERYQHKKNRDFEAADYIRDDLMNRYDVKIDDRSSEWRVDTDEYAASYTGNLDEDTIAEINGKIAERFQCKRDRDYETADAIRDGLNESYGVVIDDRTKEWRVEGVVEEEEDDFFKDLDAALDEELSDTDSEEDYSEEEEEEEAPSVSISEEELSQCTVPVLKEKLRDAGLPVSGKKSELIERLLAN